MKRTIIVLALTLLTGCITVPVTPPPDVVVYGPKQPVPDAHHSPPPVVFQSPPVVIVIPDTDNVYVVPDISADLFFWNGSWWRIDKGFWYRSQYYDRGWVYYNNVPSFYYDVDPGWRGYYKNKNWHGYRWNYERIPNQQLQKNWKIWQDNRYWESQKRWGVQGYQPQTKQQKQELRYQREEQYKKRPQVQPPMDQPPRKPPQVQQPKGQQPPPVVFQSPPVVIVIPDTDNVYVVPDISADLFFWNGSWWRIDKGFWYRSQYYDRGWVYYNNVPSFYYDVDPGWRGYYKNKNWHGYRWNYERIPNQQLQKNWKIWQDNRYWESQKRWGVQGYQPQTKQQKQELRYQREEQYKKRPQVQPPMDQPPRKPPQVDDPKKPTLKPPQVDDPKKPTLKPPMDQPPRKLPQVDDPKKPSQKPPQVDDPKKPLQDQQPQEHQPLQVRPEGGR
jgi:hypothetical protein